MNLAVCVVAIGSWYHRGAARLINEFWRVSPGFTVCAWVNTYPPGAPRNVIENGYDYSGYCAKPFALLDAYTCGFEGAILLDAAFYPIRPIHPLMHHIQRHEYFLCKNGHAVGKWASDRCLDLLHTSRSEAMAIEEVSSYCVGMDFRVKRNVELLHDWCRYAGDRLSFPGPHTNTIGGHEGRNRGFVSHYANVHGHRHDQTVLSILAYLYGMKEWAERPYLTAYLGSESEETVLVNQGMGS